MSTQSGKPLNPINHVSRKTREGSVTEPHGSPYAPKRAPQRAGTERHPVESDRDPLRSPHTPKQARAQPVTSRLAAGDDAEQPAAARRDQIMSDHDLERLEASLRQLQRQESATRLVPAIWLPCPGSPRSCERPSSQRREVRRRLSVAALARAPTTPASACHVAPRYRHSGRHRGREHLGGDSRVLLRGGRVGPVLRACAWTANDIIRSDCHRAAVPVYRPTRVPADNASRQGSCDVGAERDILPAGYRDVAASETVRGRDRGDVAG